MQHVKLGGLQQVCIYNMRTCNYISVAHWLLCLLGSEGDVLPDCWDSMIDPTTKKPVPLRVIDLAARSFSVSRIQLFMSNMLQRRSISIPKTLKMLKMSVGFSMVLRKTQSPISTQPTSTEVFVNKMVRNPHYL
jgi:hypothetical protein